MPEYVVREPVIIVDMKTRDYEKLNKWMQIFEQMLKRVGANFKRHPVKRKLIVDEKTRRKIGEYSVRYEILSSGGAGERVKELLYKLLSPKSKGYELRGTYYKWPEGIEVKISQREAKTSVKTIKRLERPPALPKEELPPEVRASFMTTDITLVAKSTDREALERFVNAAIADFEKYGCTVAKKDWFICVGERVEVTKHGKYIFEGTFTLKPGAMAIETVYLPIGGAGEGFVKAREPMRIEYEYLINKYPHLKEAIKRYSKIREYAERGIPLHKLREIDPEAYNVIVSTPMANVEYSDYMKSYHAFSRETFVKIRVVPEVIGAVKNAVVKIWLDGMLLKESKYGGEEETTHIVPFESSRIMLRVVDENGNPVPHTIRVESNEYSVQRKGHGEYYMAVLWIRGNMKCDAYAKHLATIRPDRIEYRKGFVYPELTGCQRISQ